ncbi:DUF4907 domain-containing protein [Chitinophaga sp. Cy-1792]|uniref:DUF4907 domain-containing protein n=1 Tax=Chitinophaga sp. Cy-1792 TaxID=2608339 RepID=UPI0014204052|nr:DUF4907 domain-containing protein [Chitinophaga sp. Cy-1792]
MTDKRNYLFIASFIVLIAAVAWRFKSHHQPETKPGDMLAVEVVPFQAHGGWGYKVNVDGKTYINQDIIPGIPGNQAFQSKDDAVKVGNVVMNKLTSHKIPSISEAELKELHVQF